MEINVLIGEGLKGCLEVGWLQSVVERVLAAEDVGSGVEVGLVVASQEEVQQLNRSYRGKDEPTDVLAFATMEEGGANLPPFVTPPDGLCHLGEVIISYPQAVIQAGEHQHSVEREMTILIIHGVLHLLGYDHDEPEREREMRARETEILSRVEAGLE